MKREVIIMYDDENPNQLMIGNKNGEANPWLDLALVIEGVGALTKSCLNAGITEHNGLPLREYLKQYIDKACDDGTTLTVVK